MFALCIIAFLCLLPVNYSAPAACENLVRPLDHLDFHHLKGRWALVAGAMRDNSYLEKFKTRDSASVSFGNTSENSTVSFQRVIGFSGSCQYTQSNITLKASGFSFNDINMAVTILNMSCPDCLLMSFKNESNDVLRLYLFSRRRAVDQKEMEEFRAQAECLNMLEPSAVDPTKELCPEKISDTADTDTAAQTEVKTEGQNA
ncbi:hypothetical protein L3Q82_005415 [Scortum barcoo]|uniref:Uncharacterized protein n=1 Tax=Scortum barcoo TaxID=214431 RepID=A0ACB8VAH9_9TELE|nr:hypothetical protein L3Q82_005415 [Scortum barcoo]